MFRHAHLRAVALALATTLPLQAAAQSCELSFTIEVTQGVGDLRPGTRLPGKASFTQDGESFRQEGGATAHAAHGEMQIGDVITGPIWTVITRSNGSIADLVGVHARNVEGLSVAGIPYEGPMLLTFFGPPGSRPQPAPPVTQDDWDRLNQARNFTIQGRGLDMLAGDVTDLMVDCS